MNHHIIKSYSVLVRFLSLDLEIPPGIWRGCVANLEGTPRRFTTNLEEYQGERMRVGDMDGFHWFRGFIRCISGMVGS